MEFKGTKGKWILQADNTISANNFEKTLIAQICSANNNDQEKNANAKLIEAAPELLRLLNDSIVYLNIFSTNKPNDGSVIGEHKNEVQELIKQLME